MAGDMWQAIGTVPHDKVVLIYSRRWGPIMAEFSPELGEWRSRMQCPVALKAEDDELTHWMPLPPEPASASPPALPEPSAVGYGTRIIAH